MYSVKLRTIPELVDGTAACLRIETSRIHTSLADSDGMQESTQRQCDEKGCRCLCFSGITFVHIDNILHTLLYASIDGE